MEPLLAKCNGKPVIVIAHGGAVDHQIGHDGEDGHEGGLGCGTAYLIIWLDGRSGWWCSEEIRMKRPARGNDWPG